MPSIKLTKLNTGYATDPNQPIVSTPVSAQVEALAQTQVDVTEGAKWRSGLTPTVTGYSSTTNCIASVVNGELLVTGSSVGAGSLTFTLNDGDSGVSSNTLTLDIIPSSGTASVTLTDVTATGFDDVLSVSDEITYSTSTTITGAIVTVSPLGRVTIVGTYQVGDSFTYQINGGSLQTYTFG